MKLTLESTDLLVEFQRGDKSLPVRVWKGTTEAGVPVAAFIASVSPQTHDPAMHAQFEAELRDITDDSTIERRVFVSRKVI